MREIVVFLFILIHISDGVFLIRKVSLVIDVGGDQGMGGAAWRTPCIKRRYRFPVRHAMY